MKLFNKRNITPISYGTIGTIAIALTITFIVKPTLFGLLSETTVAALGVLGLTPISLGIIIAISSWLVFSAVQQIFTNSLIEEAADKQVSVNDIDLASLVGDALKGGRIVEEKQGDTEILKLELSTTKYNALVNGAEGEKTLHVFVPGNDNSIEVKFNHSPITDCSTPTHIVVQLTKVCTETGVDKMKTALGITNTDPLNVAVSAENINDLKKAVKENVVSMITDIAIPQAVNKINR